MRGKERIIIDKVGNEVGDVGWDGDVVIVIVGQRIRPELQVPSHTLRVAKDDANVVVGVVDVAANVAVATATRLARAIGIGICPSRRPV